MKKEIIAGTLLIALFIGALMSISHTTKIIDSLRTSVCISQSLYADGRKEEAEALLKNTSDKWLSLDGYTHIFIRHSEIDSATDAFFDAIDSPSSGSYGKLIAHLDSLMGMEKLSLGSIF